MSSFLWFESTVILGWAGIADFSGVFGLESVELDFSPCRAAARSEGNEITGMDYSSLFTWEKFVHWLWVHHTHTAAQICPGSVGSIGFCLKLLGHQFNVDTGVCLKPPVFWWVHSLWRSSPPLAPVADAPDWCAKKLCLIKLEVVRERETRLYQGWIKSYYNLHLKPQQTDNFELLMDTMRIFLGNYSPLNNTFQQPTWKLIAIGSNQATL